MIRVELNKLTKEELIEMCIDLQDDNAWWERRWKVEHKIAFEKFKPRIDKAIEYIKSYLPNYDFDHSNLENILKILGDKENE